ncbi:MAG: pyridoxal-phosphate dependent enzyme [Peptoniphilaceae bacterium]|nr:pyridoxal-phosphate dependent enzyme [Peptoniphilaceae bacterium]MDY3737898.1 pyridoxal-phosphate dependent enzyme [Peptoniphilaceae bacterium]
MELTIRKFGFDDIEKKIEWINNPENNTYLHYDLPLEYDKTVKWFKENKDNKNRFDFVIEVDEKPVGLIGILSIDYQRKNGEYYICMGEVAYKKRGIAKKASNLLLNFAFNKIGLENIYLYTEVSNIPALKSFKKIGFNLLEGIENIINYKDREVKRFVLNISKADFYLKNQNTPINNLNTFNKNNIFIKRDDLIAYSFGGNKARKAIKFFQYIDFLKSDYVVTYGSSHSNHCRIVANLAAKRNIPCLIISPKESSDKTKNSIFMKLFGANIITVPVEKVSETIDKKLEELRNMGYKPYFIPGGGHGNIGTQAYLECYEEIKKYETRNNIKFDYIFLASGTGTSQAGLVCGKILNNDKIKIIGISIARKNPRGRDIIKDSIRQYLPTIEEKIVDENTIFVDDYVLSGYSGYDEEIINTIKENMINYGIPMDSTYTAKAYLGMKKYLISKKIKDKNILFIHTGGTPLFFDDLDKLKV